MNTRRIMNKRVALPSLLADVSSGSIRGLHYHERGTFDPHHDVIEMVVARTKTHTYAVKLYLEDGFIRRVERVRFEWECGGWRSQDHVLKRFPFHFYKCEEGVDGILASYIQPANTYKAL